MLSSWIARSSIGHQDSRLSRSCAELQTAVRHSYAYTFAATLITIGIFWVQTSEVGVEQDRYGLAVAVVFVVLLLLQGKLSSVMASRVITRVLHGLGGVFFGHALYATGLWYEPLGLKTTIGFVLNFSIFLYASAISAFFYSRRLQNAGIVFVTIASTLSLYLLLEADPTVGGGADKVTEAIYAPVVICIGLLLVKVDHSNWISFSFDAELNEINLERALASRIAGLLLISSLLSIFDLVFYIFVL